MFGRLSDAGSDGGCRLLASLVVSLVLTSGCHGMTAKQEVKSPGGVVAGAEAVQWPLRFVQHSFGAHCFDTIGCRILYSGFTHGVDSVDVVSPPLSSYRGTREQILSAGHIARRNFPEPARVTWRSKDGASHEADVDIGEIFKDRLVLHNVPREEVLGDVGDPAIVLEVNDRTINVYMRAFVSTRSLQVPGNKYSGFRNDLVLAWTKTY